MGANESTAQAAQDEWTGEMGRSPHLQPKKTGDYVESHYGKDREYEARVKHIRTQYSGTHQLSEEEEAMRKSKVSPYQDQPWYAGLGHELHLSKKIDTFSATRTGGYGDDEGYEKRVQTIAQNLPEKCAASESSVLDQMRAPSSPVQHVVNLNLDSQHRHSAPNVAMAKRFKYKRDPTLSELENTRLEMEALDQHLRELQRKEYRLRQKSY